MLAAPVSGSRPGLRSLRAPGRCPGLRFGRPFGAGMLDPGSANLIRYPAANFLAPSLLAGRAGVGSAPGLLAGRVGVGSLFLAGQDSPPTERHPSLRRSPEPPPGPPPTASHNG